jgi:uncharacterized coiled-coil DUF342 family protein
VTMKKPDFEKLRKQATDLKEKASELGSEAARTAGGIRKGVQTGYEASKFAFKKAGEVINKDTLSTSIDAVAKGAEVVGKSLEKASNSLKKVSKQLKGK